MKEYEIWAEGYFFAPGMEDGPAPAELIARVKAESFREACIEYFDNSTNSSKSLFDRENLSYWGCRLFDNETDARKSFG